MINKILKKKNSFGAYAHNSIASRSIRRRSKQHIFTTSLISIGAMIAIGTAAAPMIGKSNGAAKKVCEGNIADNVLVILMDVTDEINPEQSNAADKFLNANIVEKVNHGDRIVVFALQGDPALPVKPVFVGCSPKRGRDANIFLETAELAEKEWQTTFGSKLTTSFKNAVTRDFQHTPLLEGISFAYENVMQRYPDASSVKIVTLSDLLINTQSATIYTSKATKNFILNDDITAKLQAEAVPMPNAKLLVGVIERTDHHNRQGVPMYPRQLEMVDWFQQHFGFLGVPVDTITLENGGGA